MNYVVQTFTEVDGELIADMPIDAADPSEAAQLAIDLQSSKAGVIAFEWSGQKRLGRYAKPYVLGRFGQIPEECLAWSKPEEEEMEAKGRKPRKLGLTRSAREGHSTKPMSHLPDRAKDAPNDRYSA